MRLTKEETNAIQITTSDAAIDAALAYNEANNPHISGKLARVMADRSGWPDNQTFTIGVFNENGVLVGFIPKGATI